MINVIEQSVTATSNFDGTDGAATGSITTVAGASLADGDFFYLNDGKGPQTKVTFVDDASVSPQRTTSAGEILVPFGGAETADGVRDLLIAAINSSRKVGLKAGNGGAATVSLTNKVGGTHGNVTPFADQVANAGFVVSAMTGGVNRSYADGSGARSFDPATAGGLLSFPFQQQISASKDAFAVGGVLTWVVKSLYIEATGATDYTVNALGPTGAQRELATGSGAAVLVGPFDMDGDEQLQVITTGGSLAMSLKAVAEPGLFIQE